MLNERPHTAQFHLYEMCRDKRIEKGGRPGVAGEGEEGVTANSHPVSWGGWKYFTIRLWQWERDTRVPESHTPMWKVRSCPEGFLGRKLSIFPAPSSALSPGPMRSQLPWEQVTATLLLECLACQPPYLGFRFHPEGNAPFQVAGREFNWPNLWYRGVGVTSLCIQSVNKEWYACTAHQGATSHMWPLSPWKVAHANWDVSQCKLHTSFQTWYKWM